MCGRYVIAQPPRVIATRLEVIDPNRPRSFEPTWNAAPQQLLPVVVADAEGARDLLRMQWGLRPRWQRPGQRPIAPINARGETLAEKPMFRSLFRRSRCIVPADGFYEWRTTGGRKQPWYVTAADGALWGFAGLWDEVEGPDGEPLASFTIVTTAANPLLAQVHDRMPVILRPEDEELWLSREIDDPTPLEPLLRAWPESAIRLHPVGPAVNSVRNNRPDLTEPVPDDASGPDDAAPARRRAARGDEGPFTPRLIP